MATQLTASTQSTSFGIAQVSGALTRVSVAPAHLVSEDAAPARRKEGGR